MNQLPGMALMVLVLAVAVPPDVRAWSSEPGGGSTAVEEALPQGATPAPQAPADQILRRPRPPAPQNYAGGMSGRLAGWVRTGAALAAVVALIILLAWGYRAGAEATRRLGGWRWRAAGPVQLLSRLPLTPRQVLYLVRIGPRLVLVGSAGQTLTGLCVIDDADLAARLAGEQLAGDPESHTRQFHQHLVRQASGYQEVPDAGAEEATAAACRRLSQLLQHLRRVGGSA